MTSRRPGIDRPGCETTLAGTPNAETTTFVYDEVRPGYMNLQTETGTIASSIYDAAGRPTSRTFANGVTTTLTYSATRGWLENIQTLKDSTTYQDLTYTYEPDGLIQSITRALSRWRRGPTSRQRKLPNRRRRFGVRDCAIM